MMKPWKKGGSSINNSDSIMKNAEFKGIHYQKNGMQFPAIKHCWLPELSDCLSRKITEVNGKSMSTQHGHLMRKLPTATEWLQQFGQVHFFDACLRILGGIYNELEPLRMPECGKSHS